MQGGKTMICYIDEKMYGPPQDDISDEALLCEIQALELKLYGRILTTDTMEENIVEPQRKIIYSVEEKKFVDYEEFIKTEEGRRYLKECAGIDG